MKVKEDDAMSVKELLGCAIVTLAGKLSDIVIVYFMSNFMPIIFTA